MITKRISPCLDVKNGRVVKGVNFEGLSDVSSPVELAKYYVSLGDSINEAAKKAAKETSAKKSDIYKALISEIG